MSDIVEFLKARLDEDEEVARASISGVPERAEWSYEPWSSSVEGSGEVIAPNGRDDSGYPEYITCDMEGLSKAVSQKDGPHIARHDPARVLREVAAKRALLAWMGNYHNIHPDNRIYLNASLYVMAASYADHPDYQKEWAIP